MSRPSSDSAAIKQIVAGLTEAGHKLASVWDGDDERVGVRTADEVVALVTEVDMSRLFVTLSDGTGEGWVLFVMGNGDPLDLVADWTTTLTPVIDPIMATW